MLRIQLGLDDLARIRLAASGVAATIEAVYSSTELRRADGALSYGNWGQRLRPRLTPDTAPLFDLFQAPAQVPLFMIKRTDDPAEFTEHLLSLPAAQIGAELAGRTGSDTRLARRLATGDRQARQELAVALSSYHRAFADALPTMCSLVHADLAHRARMLATEGIAALLGSLHPGMRWRSPILEVDTRTDLDLDLAGRTVELTPSVFMRHGVGVLIEPETVFITYPARGSLRLASPGGDPLADLLGRTRAEALRLLHTAHTTTELAERLGVSLASASEHAAVLRRAHLVETRRAGRSVHHQLTRLGHSTLAGEVP